MTDRDRVPPDKGRPEVVAIIGFCCATQIPANMSATMPLTIGSLFAVVAAMIVVDVTSGAGTTNAREAVSSPSIIFDDCPMIASTILPLPFGELFDDNKHVPQTCDA